MNSGLTESDIKIIVTVLKQHPEIESALFFGSRALGTFQKGSDIDIALKGNNLTNKVCSDIHFVLEEETILPYFFDIINYNSIVNPNLKEHIDKYGEVFYQRELNSSKERLVFNK